MFLLRNSKFKVKMSQPFKKTQSPAVQESGEEEVDRTEVGVKDIELAVSRAEVCRLVTREWDGTSEGTT